MPKLRPVRPASRRLVHVLTGTVAAAVVLVPGTAWAAGDGTPSTDPVSGVVQQGSDALDQVVGGAPGGDTQPPAGTGSGAAPNAAPDAATTNDAAAADNPAPPPPPTLPPELQQLIEKLSPSSSCSTAIQADLTKTLTDIPSLVTGVLAALQGAGSNPDPQTVLTAIGQALGLGGLPGNTSAGAADAGSTPTSDLPADLQQLVKDLSSCLQTPPPTPNPPANNPPVTGVDDQGTPPQEVTQPETAQPVSYPGYAATGAIAPAGADHPADTAPPAALGGGVLLVSAAATAAVRSRARRAGR